MLTVLLCLSPPARAWAQDGGVAAAPGPAVHLGAFNANTPSGRSLAADVADLAARQARERGLTVTLDPPETWTGPEAVQHEGALRKCLDPWASKSAVLACLDGLTFPTPPRPPPPGTLYLVEATVTSSEQGLVVVATLYPLLDGQPGPAMVVRSLTVTSRLRRAAREKALKGMLNPLWDAALGKVGPKVGR